MSRRRPFDWQAHEDAEVIASWDEDMLRRMIARVRCFLRVLADAGLHVAVGNPPSCPACGSAWPCDHVRRQV